MTLVLFLVALAFLLGAAAFDMIETRRCIVAGVAVEKNTWLVGPTPTTRALLLKELVQSGVIVTVAVLGLLLNEYVLIAGIVSMVTFGVKHIKGGYAGYKFLHK